MGRPNLTQSTRQQARRNRLTLDRRGRWIPEGVEEDDEIEVVAGPVGGADGGAGRGMVVSPALDDAAMSRIIRKATGRPGSNLVMTSGTPSSSIAGR